MTEIWKDVCGSFTGYKYRVSNLGGVQSLRKAWRNGRLLRPFPDKNGYLRVNLYDNAGMLSQVPVHTLVAEAFMTVRPIGSTVNHKDANKSNNAAGNLEWMTTQENTAHAKSLGLMKASTAKRLMTLFNNRGG